MTVSNENNLAVLKFPAQGMFSDDGAQVAISCVGWLKSLMALSTGIEQEFASSTTVAVVYYARHDHINEL